MLELMQIEVCSVVHRSANTIVNCVTQKEPKEEEKT